MQRFAERLGDYVAPIVAGIAALLMTTIATLVLYLFHVPGDEFLLLFLILGLLTIWQSHRYHMPKLDPSRQDTLERDTSTQLMRATSAFSRRKTAPVGTRLDVGTLEASPAYEGMTRIPKFDFHLHQWEDDGGRTAPNPA